MGDKPIFIYIFFIVLFSVVPWFSIGEPDRVLSRTFKAIGGMIAVSVFAIFGVFSNGGHPTAMGILGFTIVVAGGISAIVILVSGLIARFVSNKIALRK